MLWIYEYEYKELITFFLILSAPRIVIATMTILGYVQHLSQTHLTGHLKSRPSTPVQSTPLTPVDAAPAPLVVAPLETVTEPAEPVEPAPPVKPVATDVAPAPTAETPADTGYTVEPPATEPVTAVEPASEPAGDTTADDGLTSDGLPIVDVAAIMASASTEQTAAPEVAPIAGVPVAVTEEIAVIAGDKPEEPVVVADTVTAIAVVDPVSYRRKYCEAQKLTRQTDKQPTATHAEEGNLHTPAEAATTVDGTPAEVPAAEAATEAAEVKKEDEKRPKVCLTPGSSQVSLGVFIIYEI